MPKVARGNHVDSVASATGSSTNCAAALTTSTNECSPNVFSLGTGVVREGDKVTEHNKTGCTPESPGLSSYSPNVFANGKHLGRLGDNYAGDGSNTITSGSSTVFANGN